MSELLNSPGNYNVLNIQLLQLEPLNHSTQGRIECVFGYIYIFHYLKAYLGPSQTSMMKIFCKHSQQFVGNLRND